MNVIISGMSGFVGQNFSKYLLEKSISPIGLSLRSGDWKNFSKENVAAIVHLAGKAHDTSNTSSAEEYYHINRDLTIDIFQEFVKSEIKDFFYFSSVKAVADIVYGELDEGAIAAPLTPYGRSKFEAEQYLLKQALPAGKRLFIIRPCMIHGPQNKGNLNLLYKVIKKGLPWPLASFDNRRSFLSVDNLSYLLHQILINKNVSSGIYNFSDDNALSTNDLVSLMSRCLGKKSMLWHISPALIRSLVKVGDILPMPLNSERLKKLTESYVVSNKKVKQALGIEKLPLSAEEGLEKTILSFNI